MRVLLLFGTHRFRLTLALVLAVTRCLSLRDRWLFCASRLLASRPNGSRCFRSKSVVLALALALALWPCLRLGRLVLV